ncbi:cyanophycinase [Undibacterium fentianense]|uniref:Cyanophycinase n=1 Tax=Undibacterium fentianense TaxID=2828728 RepID=A0A941DX41_9BURK|nr:cyanophycinase [Undibacterium fentianense]MBR7798999.1 cyanophycinase [Undibacterium fentianense]
MSLLFQFPFQHSAVFRIIKRFTSWISYAGIALCLFSSPVRAEANADTQVKGSLAIIGGALRYDNSTVWQRIVQEAGGQGARIAVIPAASASPERSGQHLVKVLKQYGADAYLLPLSIKYLNEDGQQTYFQVARDPLWLDQLKNTQAVYFSGGDQSRITKVLINEDGSRTPLLEAIWDLYRRGGLIAGTSAGAAIMSETMFSNAKSVLHTLQNKVKVGREIDQGLGFIGPNILVDQHLIIRGRFARMLPVMQSQRIPLGLGVDENTAMFIFQQRFMEVVGYKGAIVLNLNQPNDSKRSPFQMQNARIHYLSDGDKYDLASHLTTPSPEKELIQFKHSEELDQQPQMLSDILANSAVVELLSHLIESPARSMKGLAFDPRNKQSSLGFEFQFAKTAGSQGYVSSRTGMDAFTVLDIRLDVRPVKIRKPIYQNFN